MSETVYLNGKFMPREDAKISPDDRGFIFADGVYEVAKYYKRQKEKEIKDKMLEEVIGNYKVVIDL